MNLIGKNIGEGGGREEIPGYTTERLCAKAKEHGIYIQGAVSRRHFRGKAIGKYECADFAGGEDSGDIQQTAYV